MAVRALGTLALHSPISATRGLGLNQELPDIWPQNSLLMVLLLSLLQKKVIFIPLQ